MRSVLACGLVVALAQLLGCDPVHPLPADQMMGKYDFTARRPLLADAGLDLTPIGSLPICPLEPETGFEAAFRELLFIGTFTSCSGRVDTPYCSAANTGQVYFTATSSDRPAGFDGQYAWLEPLSEPREFSACIVDGGSCLTTVTETMRVALYSLSQTYASGLPFRCPPNALDGGVPAPDGGVVAPAFTPQGFDAVFACGDLIDVVHASPGCACVRDKMIPTGECAIYYRVTGESI
jgi:hypothetical protein